MKKIKFLTVLASCATLFGLAGCSQDNNQETTKMRLTTFSSETNKYATGDRVSLKVQANTLYEECVLKTVDITYQDQDNVSTASKTCSVSIDQDAPKVGTSGYNYNISGIFYKNENQTQAFTITKFTYFYNNETYAETTNLKYTIFLKEKDYSNASISVGDISLVKYSSTDSNPEQFSAPAYGENEVIYSITDTMLSKTIPAVLIKDVQVDNVNVNTLNWIFKITDKNQETREITVPNQGTINGKTDLILPIDGKLNAQTARLELIGATYSLEIAPADSIGKTFSMELNSNGIAFNIEISEIEILDVSVTTNNFLTSQNGEYFLDNENFQLKNSYVSIKCDLKGKTVNFTSISLKQNGEDVVISALPEDKKVSIDNFPSFTLLTFWYNYGHTGKHTLSDFSISGFVNDSETSKKIADSNKEVVVNVIDAFIENAASFRQKIAEKPSGYYALTSDLTLSANTSFICDNFTGTLNGNGHRIKIVSQSSAWFRKNSGTIKHFIVSELSTSLLEESNNRDSSALIASENDGTIENISIRNLEINVNTPTSVSFKGIVTQNSENGVIRNVEFNIGGLKYSGNYSPNEITGICYKNLGKIYSIYANYLTGTYWTVETGKTTNLITCDNFGIMADIICDFHLDAGRNQFNKINLFYKTKNDTAQTSRLFYNELLIDDVQITSFVSTSNPTKYSEISTLVKANSLYVVNPSDISHPTVGINWSQGREYVLGFDSKEVHDNKGHLISIYHNYYSETIENVESIQEAEHDFGKWYLNGEEQANCSANAYVFTGKINSGSKVTSEEMRTPSWFYDDDVNKGVRFNSTLWNSTSLTLRQTPDFTKTYA